MKTIIKNIKRIIKNIKRIFETFTIFNLSWDMSFGISLIILETMLTSSKANNINNLVEEKALFRLDINRKRINYSILYSKLKIINYEK